MTGSQLLSRPANVAASAVDVVKCYGSGDTAVRALDRGPAGPPASLSVHGAHGGEHEQADATPELEIHPHIGRKTRRDIEVGGAHGTEKDNPAPDKIR